MSARESSDALLETRDGAAAGEAQTFTRWPGLLSLSLCVLLGPVVALANQELIYVSNMWACGHRSPAAMHIVPALCLLATIGAGILAYRDWKAVGGGVHDSAASVDARTRFLAILGITISVFSAMVILAQWASIFVFAPCMRA